MYYKHSLHLEVCIYVIVVVFTVNKGAVSLHQHRADQLHTVSMCCCCQTDFLVKLPIDDVW